MIPRFTFPALLFTIAAGPLHAACSPIRFAYPDQNRPPYWLGNGNTVAEPPGASVELVREFTASVGCPVSMVRLPVLRLRPAVESGMVDFAPSDASAAASPQLVLPRDASGQLDMKRSSTITIVAFVRAADAAKANTDPLAWLAGRPVGTTIGATYADQLQKAGMQVDQGGTSVAQNLEKLKLHRIDAFAVSLITVGDMDSYIAQKYGNSIVRIEKPLFKSHIWLAANKVYYDAHQPQVEAMWTWLGGEGNKRFGALLKKYTDMP